jgi:hypothetical protein
MSLARSYDEPSAIESAPAAASVSTAPAAAAPSSSAPTSWMSHVKEVWATLKAADPATTYKEAMTHAKASFKK